MKTHRSALAVAALAGATALVLSGCSTAVGGGAEDANVLTFASGSEETTQKLIDGFEAANPGVSVKAEFIESDASYIQQLRTRLSGGTAPDVFKVWAGGGGTMATWKVATDGLVAELDDQPWAADVPDNVRYVSSLDDKLYALPSNLGAIGALYNDQALAAVGASIPQTWTQVLDLCKTAAANGKVAYALGNKDAWTTQLIPYALTATLVYGPNPGFSEEQADGSATFSDSTWSDALDKTKQMMDAGCFNAGPNGTSYDAQMTLLGQGEALGAVQVSQAISAAEQYAADGATFSMAPLPATDEVGAQYYPTGVGVSFAINAKAKNPELAQKFLAYVASPAGQKLWAEVSGSMPALPSDERELSPVLEAVETARSAGLTTQYYPDQVWPSTAVQDGLLVDMQRFYNGEITGATVLENMDEAYKAS